MYIPFNNLGFTITLGDVELAEVEKLGGLEFKVDSKEKNVITSKDGFKDWVATLKEIGDIAITAFETKEVRTYVNNLFLNVSTSSEAFYVPLTITFPDMGEGSREGFKFNGFVQSVKDADYTAPDLQKIDILYKVKGRPTLVTEPVEPTE